MAQIKSFDKVTQWLRDIGLQYKEGGAEGATVNWSISLTFGGVVHLILVHDRSLANAIHVVGPVQVSPEHQAAIRKMPELQKPLFERNIAHTLFFQGKLSSRLSRGPDGIPVEIQFERRVLLSEADPSELVEAIYEVRNAVFRAISFFQEVLGEPSGLGIEGVVQDPEYVSVVLHKETFHRLAQRQVAGETLDETLLRLLDS